MKIVRTQRAIDGYREVASYIAREFGRKAVLEFRERVKDWTEAIKRNPKSGSRDLDMSTDEIEYRHVPIYRRSRMEYRVEGDIIYIVDFYDTRHSAPESYLFE